MANSVRHCWVYLLRRKNIISSLIDSLVTPFSYSLAILDTVEAMADHLMAVEILTGAARK